MSDLTPKRAGWQVIKDGAALLRQIRADDPLHAAGQSLARILEKTSPSDDEATRERRLQEIFDILDQVPSQASGGTTEQA